MADVVLFVPRDARFASENLAEFIRLAREDLTAFGGRDGWEEHKWRLGKTSVVFATKTKELTSHRFTPMAEPFIQFAKAYVRYTYSHKPVKNIDYPLRALRCIEAALLESRGGADVSGLNGAVMDVAAAKCREFYKSDDERCQTGRQMARIVEFLREKKIVPSLQQWKSPFPKPKILTEDIGGAGKAHRAAKLPSNEAMFALAEMFAAADDVETQYFSSIATLLMVAPSRISEVLALPVDCIQWDTDEYGAPQMCLRWRAAKGKGATKKWVPSVMQDVVIEAVRRLTQIGAPARAAARFAHDHPGRFMDHPGCVVTVGDAADRLLMPNEVAAALGLRVHRKTYRTDGTPTWSQVVGDKRLKKLLDRGDISYKDLAAYVFEGCAGPDWPFIDDSRTVKIWDALCLHRVNEFHREHEVKRFSWAIATSTMVNDRLGGSSDLSLFEKKGYRNSDGSPIKLTTHQPRHWLNTLSQRGGMDEMTLAQWSGRARVADNAHYDHRSPEERMREVRDILKVEHKSLLERFQSRQPVTYQELGVDRLGTAKATLYGMCVHDYAMSPCQKQRECMTCKEHVCIKGDHVTLERILLLEAQTKALLDRALEAREAGDFGADRWVDNHKWKLAHVQAMRMTLEHDGVPDGTVLRIPDGHDPSPVRRALIELGVVLPDALALHPRVIPLALA